MISTRLTSSSLLTGLLKKSSQPAATARSMSPNSLSAGDHEDHDLPGFRVALERLADLKAAQLRHHDVQQDQIGLELGHLGQRVAAVNRHGRLAIDAFQVGQQQFHVRNVIVGNEDFALGHG